MLKEIHNLAAQAYAEQVKRISGVFPRNELGQLAFNASCILVNSQKIY